jgi:exodeoxyribonuclease VII small subunit
VAEIEQILARLKSEQTDVDKLSAEVKRATELIAQCKARLTEVESTLKAQLAEE